MKKTIFMLILFCVFIVGANQAQAIHIDIIPSVTNVNVGDSFSVDLFIRDLGGSDLGAFSLSLNFNDNILNFNNSVTFGTSLGDPLAGEAITDATYRNQGINGFVDLFDVSLLSVDELAAQPYGFTLATIGFTVESLPTNYTGLFYLNNVVLSDAFGNDLHYDYFNTNSVTIRNDGTIITNNNNAVPEPSSIVLLGFGLFSIVGLRELRKQVS